MADDYKMPLRTPFDRRRFLKAATASVGTLTVAACAGGGTDAGASDDTSAKALPRATVADAASKKAPDPLSATPFRNDRTNAQFATLQSAIDDSQSGDTIEGTPGTYFINPTVLVSKHLTIKSSQARTKVVLDGQHSMPDMPILSVAAECNLTLEDFEIRNNKTGAFHWSSGLNVAGSGSNVIARYCKFSECNNNVFTANTAYTGSIRLENCEVVNGGSASTQSHNFYVGVIDSLTLRGCLVHNTKTAASYVAEYGPGNEWRESWGHLVKCRAKAVDIEGCRLTMEAENPSGTVGGANCIVDFSCGGDLRLVGNLIEYKTKQDSSAATFFRWGVEGAYGVPGTKWDRSVWRIVIQQNTIVSNPPGIYAGNNMYCLWVGEGTESNEGGNASAVPAPSVYSVVDNVFAGFAHNPPYTAEYGGRTGQLYPFGYDTVYALSPKANTYGAKTLLTNYAAYDYSMVTPVAGSQAWATLQYVYPTGTTARSDAYRGALPAVIDGTAFTYDGTAFTYSTPTDYRHPSRYKGNQTFKALAGLRDNIDITAGGWREIGPANGLPSTTIRDDYMEAGAIDAIGPISALRQMSLPKVGSATGYQTCVWESACWNGFGFFHLPAGGHSAGYRNDLYHVRLADPIGTNRIHDCAPLSGVVVKTNVRGVPRNYVEDIAYASSYSPGGDQLWGCPAWGPNSEHQNDGIIWDAANERMIIGGDNQRSLDNPTAYGQPAVGTPRLSVFNPYGATPKSAWQHFSDTTNFLPQGAGTSGEPTGSFLNNDGFALPASVDNADGTVSFTSIGTYLGGRRSNFSAVTGQFTVPSYATQYGPQPIGGDYHASFRDPATNKYYEIYGNASAPTTAGDVLECLADGTRTPVGSGPVDLFVSNDNYADVAPGVVVVNSKAYMMSYAAAAVGSTLTLKVCELDLSTGAKRYHNDKTTVTMPGGVFNGATNGVQGRWAYIPQIKCFAFLPSPSNNVWLFRPPSSWGL